MYALIHTVVLAQTLRLKKNVSQLHVCTTNTLHTVQKFTTSVQCILTLYIYRLQSKQNLLVVQKLHFLQLITRE